MQICIRIAKLHNIGLVIITLKTFRKITLFYNYDYNFLIKQEMFKLYL